MKCGSSKVDIVGCVDLPPGSLIPLSMTTYVGGTLGCAPRHERCVSTLVCPSRHRGSQKLELVPSSLAGICAGVSGHRRYLPRYSRG